MSDLTEAIVLFVFFGVVVVAWAIWMIFMMIGIDRDLRSRNTNNRRS